jgi:hypothetical protein
MVDNELTQDDSLRAVAALEAISKDDDTRLTVLTGPGERPLPDLLAAYGQHVLQRLMLAAFGADPTMGADEIRHITAEINADQQARIVFLLADTLKKWAATAGDEPVVAKQIGTTVLLAVGEHVDGDVQVVLQALRAQVLQRG